MISWMTSLNASCYNYNGTAGWSWSVNLLILLTKKAVTEKGFIGGRAETGTG